MKSAGNANYIDDISERILELSRSKVMATNKFHLLT